jgi:hypothetical protein
MLCRRSIGAVLIVLFVTCAAPISLADATSPIHIDPGSPAGKQYGIPLWVLRGEGSGQQSPQGVPPPPLFGVGIGPAGANGGSGVTGGGASRGAAAGGSVGSGRGSGRAGAGGQSGRGGRGGSPSRGGANAENGSLTAATIAQLTRESSSTPLIALIAAAVLLAGLALGTVMLLAGRRRRSA